MIYILAIILIFATLIILIMIGKPLDIIYKVDKFLDSFEKTDYNKEGRIKHDYLFWNFSDYKIKINYWIIYKWKNFPFNRKNKVSVKLDNIKLPDGFEISLVRNSDDYQEHNIDYEMELVDCNEFYVKIAQIENKIDLGEPQPSGKVIRTTHFPVYRVMLFLQLSVFHQKTDSIKQADK